ncbi:hypothetical protein EJO83_28620 [Salmonella enterica]|uniref:Carrier domain-containing protein n=1 Tax=Salmonella diarizonae TaxID=59204 RepID=A0A5Y1YFT0_SALDZ|nr:hypothetical protein [Salmonella enterica]EBE1093031.1 hypothetical protein [Salmonella enterica]ECC3917843.1 hypothetical protein [Salmonella enterica subsp. diarizonae]ECO8340444.1 hypothetical protein [Salmonella enterica]
MDAIASNRRRLGLAGQSLAWGLWTDGDERALGLASGLDAAQRARLQKTGIGVITPELGERLFVRALGHDGDNLFLAPIDLLQLKDYFGSLLPALWQDLLTPEKVTSVTENTSLIEELLLLTDPARLERIVDLVRTEIRDVLAINAIEVQPNRPLSEIGLDSLTAVELRNALRKRTGKNLPATLAFDYPTIADIAAYILRLLAPELMPNNTFAKEFNPQIKSALRDTAGLSDEEVDDELAQYINEFLK